MFHTQISRGKLEKWGYVPGESGILQAASARRNRSFVGQSKADRGLGRCAQSPTAVFAIAYMSFISFSTRTPSRLVWIKSLNSLSETPGMDECSIRSRVDRCCTRRAMTAAYKSSDRSALTTKWSQTANQSPRQRTSESAD